jgi:hypothetical protein
MKTRKSGIVLFDAGGPLLFIFGFHLIIGNFFIGLAEYYFVKKVFKIALNRFGLLLIVAGNYLSLIAGLYASLLFNFKDGRNTFQAMLGPLTITLVVSIILEWAFFYFAIKKVAPETKVLKTIYVTASAQVFSYSLMLAYYFIIRVNN